MRRLPTGASATDAEPPHLRRRPAVRGRWMKQAAAPPGAVAASAAMRWSAAEHALAMPPPDEEDDRAHVDCVERAGVDPGLRLGFPGVQRAIRLLDE
jgi:hypothetical protein